MPPEKSAANRSLARAIRSVREQQRYSQESFALHIGLHRTYYGTIERGGANVSLDTIAKIANGLDTTITALCEQAKL